MTAGRESFPAIGDWTFITSAVTPAQYPPAGPPEIAFVGRSNVGKSSLINALARRHGLALTSKTPGRTRLVNFFRATFNRQEFRFIDLPGYGFAKAGKDLRRQWVAMMDAYLDGRETLELVVVLVDCRHDPTDRDQAMVDACRSRNLPHLVVATKADKLPKTGLDKARAAISRGLQLRPDDVVMVSAETGLGLARLWSLITPLLATPQDS